MEFRADLHCHSTCSDGTVTPKELVDLALSLGLSALAITDHDTVEGYFLAEQYAKEKGLALLSGSELSTVHGRASIHILAYAFRPDHPLIQAFCLEQVESRRERNCEILVRLRERGMEIAEEELMSDERVVVGRPHIAQVLLNKGYVYTLQDAFNKYIGDGKPCYVPAKRRSARDVVEVIHEAGGFAVLAHPHLIKQQSVVGELLEMPFDGIEGYYSRFNFVRNLKWLEIASEKGFFVTGGSDFHGTVKPGVALGCAWAPEKTFNKLWAHFKGDAFFY